MPIYLMMEAEHAKVNDAAGAFFEKKRINRWCLKGGSEYQFFQIFSSVPAFFPDSRQYKSQVEFWGGMFDVMSGYSLEEKAGAVIEMEGEGPVIARGQNNVLCFFSEKSEAPVVVVHRNGIEGAPLALFAQRLSRLGKIAAYSTVEDEKTRMKSPVRRHDIEYLLLGESAEGGEVIFPFQLRAGSYEERGGVDRPALPVRTWVSETDEDGAPSEWSSDAVAAANGVDSTRFEPSPHDD